MQEKKNEEKKEPADTSEWDEASDVWTDED